MSLGMRLKQPCQIMTFVSTLEARGNLLLASSMEHGDVCIQQWHTNTELLPPQSVVKYAISHWSSTPFYSNSCFPLLVVDSSSWIN